MSIAVINAEYGFGTSGNPSVLSTEWNTLPTTGDALCVMVYAPNTVTSFTDNAANAYTQEAVGFSGLLDGRVHTGALSGLTSLSCTQSSAALVDFFVVEASGVDQTNPGAGQDSGSHIVGTTFQIPYTTEEDGELVIALLKLASSRTITGDSGTTAITDGSLNKQAVYKIVGSAGAGTLDYTLGAALSSHDWLLMRIAPATPANEVVPVPGIPMRSYRKSGRYL